MSSDSAYLADGHFSTDRMLDFWESNVGPCGAGRRASRSCAPSAR